MPGSKFWGERRSRKKLCGNLSGSRTKQYETYMLFAMLMGWERVTRMSEETARRC